jgi:Domain of unknown function (DUF4352)
MFPLKTVLIILFAALFSLIACLPVDELSASQKELTGFPQPTTTIMRTLPTPSSLGDPILWQDLQVNMTQTEITDHFINEFGSQRIPSAGQKFLWVHVALKNAGKNEIPLPASEHFSVLYAESEFKPVYGHRQGYVDYTTLGPTLFPGQELDAWLRFDIPMAADLKEVWFVFLPESAQVGVSPSSPNYPYAENKPTYVWRGGL